VIVYFARLNCLVSAPLLAAPLNTLSVNWEHSPLVRGLPINPKIFIDRYSLGNEYLSPEL
jgi:hypothetical protein